jgi:hypothetical protein
VNDLLASGRVADLILFVVTIEVVALAALWLRTGRGAQLRLWTPRLLAAAALVLALRASLTGEPQPPILGWLAAAGGAHVLDLIVHWRTVHAPGGSRAVARAGTEPMPASGVRGSCSTPDDSLNAT